MANNRGHTSLKGKRRTRSPMQDYDNLPKELREWLSQAALPWSAASVRKAYARAIARTGDKEQAFQELDRLQMVLVSKDTARIWETGHPNAKLGSV